VGNLIGDLVLSGTGEEEGDCLPHKAVAALTEENPDFCGEGSSLTGETSALGVGISFSATGFGDSLGGGVGNGLENLDDATEGDGDGDAGCGDLSDEIDGDLIDSGFDAIDGDLIDSGFGDCCAVPKAPDMTLSDFFGTTGEAVFGVLIDSGLGDCCEMLGVPDTLLSRSIDDGFLATSGAGALSNFAEIWRGLTGVMGFSPIDALGLLVTGGSSDVPLALGGSELGRMCLGLTNGAAATVAFTFSGTFSASGSDFLAAGFFLFGPRARPLVMCVNSGAGPDGSSWAGLEGEDSPTLDVDFSLAIGGGPRASIPASAGLKRSASLLGLPLSFFANSGAGDVALSSFRSRFGRSTPLKLFFLANASGTTFFSSSLGIMGNFDMLFERSSLPRTAMASGTSVGFEMLSDRLSVEPSS
jgi:hypothetical protein